MSKEKKSTQQSGKSILITGLIVVFYVSIIFFIVSRYPSPEKLLEALKELYVVYGYPIVFLSAVFEGLFLVGNYIPGTAAILLGAAIAKTGVLKLPVVILLGSLGLIISYSVNYFLGRYGWYHVFSRFGLDKPLAIAEDKLKKHKGKAIFLGFFAPNSAALLSTAAGVTGMPFRTLLLLGIPSQLFWSTLWGVIAYTIGITFVEIVIKYLVIVMWIVIAIWFGRRYLKKKNSIIP